MPMTIAEARARAGTDLAGGVDGATAQREENRQRDELCDHESFEEDPRVPARWGLCHQEGAQKRPPAISAPLHSLRRFVREREGDADEDA